jgi:hypothetical protein
MLEYTISNRYAKECGPVSPSSYLCEQLTAEL